MDELMKRLGELYARLDEALPRTEGNPCKDCLGCCSVVHVIMHRIGMMEMDYLSRHVEKEKVELFKDYIFRKKDETGEVAQILCPLYSKEIGGCSIYHYRPVSCRLFGHYYLTGSSVPDSCVFKERGAWIKAGDYFDVIPFAKEFRSLNRQYLSCRPYTKESMDEQIRFAEGFGTEPIIDDEEYPDAVDRALSLQLREKRDEAYEIFVREEEKNADSPYFYFYFGNLCDEMERYEEAVKCFRKALALKDDDSLFHFRLAMDLVIMGHHEEAMGEFRKVIELNPQNAMAWGYIGYLNFQSNDLKGAVENFGQALALDASQHLFRFRRALALLGLGRGWEAEEELLKVKDIELFSRDVGYLLAEIGRIKEKGDEAR
jgi:tetratricopeptide (TPR) repeat protein